jgi:hypothetical protein
MLTRTPSIEAAYLRGRKDSSRPLAHNPFPAFAAEHKAWLRGRAEAAARELNQVQQR